MTFGALPADPALADVAAAMEAHGFAGEVWDTQWRLAYLSSEYRVLISAGRRDVDQPGVGEHVLSTAAMYARERWPTGPTVESFIEAVREWGGFVVATTPGGREALREVADQRVQQILDEVLPAPPPSAWSFRADVKFGSETIGNEALVVGVHGADGAHAGFVVLVKPELRAGVLGMLALGDVRVFERMSAIVQPARRPAAMLFADLEGSTALARTLPTPAYFGLIRRFAMRADRAVVDAGGIVGKHVGDGVTAFFLVDDGVDESSAARSCFEAMRAIRSAAAEAAERSGLDIRAMTMRFGLHWGATLYVGRLITSGRIEVTALGDEVNEAARIEACASGGRALASKALVERLAPQDAGALGINAAAVVYSPLGDVSGATEKARRDAPAIAVCEL